MIIIIICLKQSSCDCKREKTRHVFRMGCNSKIKIHSLTGVFAIVYVPPLGINHLAAEFLKQLLLKVRQMFRVTA